MTEKIALCRHVNDMEDLVKLSEPRPGRTIWASLLRWTIPIRSSYSEMTSNAGSQLVEKIRNRYIKSYLPLLPVQQSSLPDGKELLQLASSALLLIWMIHRRVSGSHSSFREAESWFLGEKAPTNGLSFAVDDWPSESSTAKISDLTYDGEFDDALPYIAEIFETQQADLSSNRLTKRNIGLYYTPSDVTEHMVREVLKPWLKSEKSLRDIICLDPACGSGVFLRALLSSLSDVPTFEDTNKFDVSNKLYGFDASWQAIQSCAFTLFLDCVDDLRRRSLNSWLAWQSIRSNLAVVDSTRIAGVGATDLGATLSNARIRSEARANISHGELLGDFSFSENSSQRSFTGLLGDIFGEAAQGFSLIIGNPPYSGSIMNGKQLMLDGHPDLRARLQLGYYIPFVEMMWRFANSSYSTSAMVLPLSIAFHSGEEFRQLRKNIQSIGGSWRFQFFDRTPDSLFGDLIKTRNCIVFAELLHKCKGRSQITTTPLVRWNSRKRKEMFASNHSVSLREFPIERCIPKLGSELEIRVYKRLRSQPLTVRDMIRETPDSLKHIRESATIYFYSTAYNWLPVFRHVPKQYLCTGNEFRANSLICKDSEQADFLFGMLSSRVAYWLWRVEGDGFHLNRTFLLDLPFHASQFSEALYAEIAELARELWDEVRHYPVKKLNAGKVSISYRPYACRDILDRLDMKILKPFEITDSFGPLLRDYVVDTVIAGRDAEPKQRSIIQQLVGKRC